MQVALVVATMALATEGVSSYSQQCEADHQCESGYCYLQTKLCVPCTDCSVYRRTALTWKTCAKSPQECGKCQEGFEEVILTGGDKRDICFPKSKQESQLLESYTALTVTAIVLGIILVTTLAATIAFYVWRAVKNRMNLRNNSSDEESTLPPPYTTMAPLLSPNTVISDERVDEIQVDGRKENYPLQQAVPFRDALPPFNSAGEIEPAFDQDEEDDLPVAHFASTPFSDLDDEDTMPSTWSPEVTSPCFAPTAPCFTPTENANADQEVPSRSNEASSDTSVSDLSESASDEGDENQTIFHDSGLSATCSHQSSSTSLSSRPFEQFSTSNTDEGNDTYQQCKRARRDSGSASMQSCAATVCLNHETNLEFKFQDQPDVEERSNLNYCD